jgi:hypothetical protein
MHPADEFKAFNALHEQGLSVPEIAVRFGASEKKVEQRLRFPSEPGKVWHLPASVAGSGAGPLP